MQIDLDVAQRFATDQWSKRHGQELVQTREVLELVFAEARR